MMRINKKIWIWLLVISFFGGMVGRYLTRAPKRHYCDFRAYHHVAQDFLAGKALYVRESMEVLPFKYSPFFAFLFSLLGLLPIKAAATIFFIFNFFATILLFRLSKKISIHAPPSPKRMFLIYALAVMFMARLVVYVWDSGQVNIVMCVLVLAGLCFYFKRQNIPASFMMAVSVLFKYTPALFIPYFFLRRKFKLTLWIALFLVLLLLLPAVGVGLQKNTDYLKSWLPSIVGNSLDEGSYTNFKNQSLFSMVLRFTTPTEFRINVLNLSFAQGLKLSYVMALLLYLLPLWPAPYKGPGLSAGPPGRKDTAKIDCAMIFICMALFNPNGWMTNFVALAFPYVLVLGYLDEVRWKDKFVMTLVFLSFVLTSWMSQDIVGNDLENLSEIFSCVTIVSLFLMAALVKIKFSKSE